MAKNINTTANTAEKHVSAASLQMPTLAPLISTEKPWMAFGNIGLLQVVLALVGVMMVGMSFKNGITGDDIVVNEYGKAIIRYITSFGADDYVFHIPKSIDRDVIIQNYGGLFSVICALFNKISPFPEYTTIHIFNALSGFVATYYTAKICQRYFGNAAAIFSVFLMFLAPFWLGNAMNNPKDTPFAAAFIASIYYIFIYIENMNAKDVVPKKFFFITENIYTICVWLAVAIIGFYFLQAKTVLAEINLPELFKNMPNPTPQDVQMEKMKYLANHDSMYTIALLIKLLLIPISLFIFFTKGKNYIIPILAIAFSINIRVGGILLIPYFVVFAVGHLAWRIFFNNEKINFVFSFTNLLGISIVAYFATSLMWPFAYQNPIYNPIDALNELTHIRVGLNQLFDGHKIMSGVSDPNSEDGVMISNFPTYYLPKVISITTPYLVLIGFALIAPIMLLIKKNKKDYQTLIVLFTLFCVAFPLAYIIYKKSNVYHLWRHLLFIFPSMCIFAAWGYSSLANYFSNKSIKYVVYGLFALLALEPAYFIVTTFPNTMSYFNSMVGGTKGAYGNYEVDFYYNSVKESSDWFRKNVVSKLGKSDTIILATNGPHIVEQYFKDEPRVKTIYVRWQQRNASKYDYSLFHIAMIPQGIIKSGSWAEGSNVLYKACVQGLPMCAVVKKPSNKDVEGMEMLKAQNIQGIQLMEEYAKQDPKNELVNTTIAGILLNNDSAVKALPYIQQALSADSQSIESLSLMGEYYNKTNNADKAISYFEKVLAQEPTYLKPYIDIGIVKAGKGDINGALESINKATVDLQFAPQAFQVMANIYAKIGNAAEAQKYMQQSQQANAQLQQAMQRR